MIRLVYPLLLVFFSSLSAAANFPIVKPIDLRCEYRRNPQGIDALAPRLSWRMEVDDAAAKSVSQSAYRILVASSGEALAKSEGDLWDSGRVASSDSIQILYKGKPLSSRMPAFWKVQIWDNKEQSSTWSEPASWSMGLLEPGDWKAQWMGLDRAGGDADLAAAPEKRVLPARMLRKEFSAGDSIKRATVYFSGLGLSELYVNGAKVSSEKTANDVLSPGLTDYSKRVLYVAYDVTDRVEAGKNAVGLLLGNGRYWAPRTKDPFPTRNFGYPKSRLQLEIEYADGKRDLVSSDATWKLTTDGPIRANNEYDGEVYDATAEQQGWSQPGFDDSRWHPVQIVDAPQGRMSAQMAEPLRVTETLKPVKVTQLRPGVFIYDMGQNMVGWCRIQVHGPRGTQIVLRHAETLKPDGSLYVANLRSAKATDSYTLKGGGREDWQPRFTYHGFRYVEMTGFPGTPDLSAIEGQVVHDDMERTEDFTSSNDMLNRIHHNMFWGIRGNYRSIPTDCPQRDERQGWLGDRSVVSLSETYFYNVAAFYSKWTDDIADSQTDVGGVPDVSPNYWKMYNNDVTWPSTFIQVPAMLYDQYADLRAIRAHYDAMKLWVAHTRTFMKDGLLPKDTYGDWCVPPEDPKLIHSKDPARQTDGTLLATAYFFLINSRMAHFAQLLGREPEAAQFTRIAEELKAAFNRTYFHPESGWYANNTQTANILPLAFGMTPASDTGRVVQALADNIRLKSDGHVGTGLVGSQWLMRTLTENGLGGVALEIATQPTYPGWGYMVSKGATTIWELWNGDTADPAMNSGNHVMQMGDLGVWMYEDLAGIRSDPEQPGFKHILLHPHPVDGLSFVRASHRSLYGKIGSEWHRDGNRLTLAVTISPNTTATVWVPGTPSGSPPPDGKLLRKEADFSVYEIGSGSYHFESIVGPN